MSRSFCTKASLALLAVALVLPACRKSPTTKQIKGFADKVCACNNAACAKAVEVEYLEWWKGNMRARGSEGDRKGVEKAMQRYAECNLALVGPESVEAPAGPVPEVNLHPPVVPAPEPGSVASDDGAETVPVVAPESESDVKPQATEAKAPVPKADPSQMPAL